MKLIKFLHTQNIASNKRKLLSLFIVTLNREIKSINFDTISTKFNISNQQIQIYFKELPEIEIENMILKFEIKGVKIHPKWTRKKQGVELTTAKKEFIQKVLDTLNEITGKRYKITSAKNKSCILARINEGYIFDEFVHVIHGQSIRWLGTDSELYLRPETLFGTKMEGYVNAPIPKSNPNQNKLQKINEAINTAKEYDWNTDN